MSDETAKVTRTMSGRVVSNKANKSITVLLERRERHPLYGKYVRRSSKVHAHDESNECQMGDTVVIEQSRPLSKTKSWRLVKIIERAS